MVRIVLATGNLGKVAEFQALFAKTPIDIVAQSEFQLESVEETGTTFLENALLKARYVHHHTKLPTIADDSGLEVDALDGAPGIYSARFAGLNATPAEHINKLLKELGNLKFAKARRDFIACWFIYKMMQSRLFAKVFGKVKFYFHPKVPVVLVMIQYFCADR